MTGRVSRRQERRQRILYSTTRECWHPRHPRFRVRAEMVVVDREGERIIGSADRRPVNSIVGLDFRKRQKGRFGRPKSLGNFLSLSQFEFCVFRSCRWLVPSVALLLPSFLAPVATCTSGSGNLITTPYKSTWNLKKSDEDEERGKLQRETEQMPAAGRESEVRKGSKSSDRPARCAILRGTVFICFRYIWVILSDYDLLQRSPPKNV